MTTKISARAERVWKRFAQWYGADVIIKQFGEVPPPDWCAAIDRADNEAIQRALDVCRAKHPTWPPRLGEFEAALRPPEQPNVNEQNAQSKLAAYVLRNCGLTERQRRLPWNWLHTGKRWSREDFAIVGVEVPADSPSPGHRVMLVDITEFEDAA